MRNAQVIVLGLLLVVLAGVFCFKTLPRLKSLPRRKSAIESTAPLGLKVRLPDGSFNPNSPVKAACSDDPAKLVASMNWRERYASILGQPAVASETTSTALGFYVYPFLDLTSEGVSADFTYGWYLTGMAALAQWTDAPLALAERPANYGLPRLDELNSTHSLTLATWQRKALQDPATRTARYIVTGAYDEHPQSHQFSLTIQLTDRKTGKPQDLFTTTSVRRGDFIQMAALQRSAARQMAESLIRSGLVHPRPSPEVKTLDLEREMNEVARLMDAGDSWALMEGIDRALALSRIFPHETLPIQAATYGMNQLVYAYLSYAVYSDYSMEYGLRAYALAQISMAMDPRPALTGLNWHVAAGNSCYSDPAIMRGESGHLPGLGVRELQAYRSHAAEQRNLGLGPAELSATPDWLNLWAEAENSWFISNSGDRTLFNACVDHWATHDLYLQALIQGYDNRYAYKNMSMFQGPVIASQYATAGAMAAEVAATLTAMGDQPETDRLLDQLANLVHLTPAKLKRLAARGDFYGLRMELIKTFGNSWAPPADETHPVYRVISTMKSVISPRLSDPRWMTPATGFAGLEFTPSERVRFYYRRDSLGPMLIARFESQRHGDYEALQGVLKAYLKTSPNSGPFNRDSAKLVENYLQYKGAQQFRFDCLSASYNYLPLISAPLCELARIHFDWGERAEAMACLKAYIKANPYDVNHFRRIGELYRTMGYHALAVKALGEYTRVATQRYDIANERAWSLCQMGHVLDPEVRETFARPAPLLPGNNTFHEDNLEYLFNWAKDLKAARAAAGFYLQTKRQDHQPYLWLARIAQKEGKTSEALAVLARVTDEGKQGLGIAVAHAQVAEAYMDLNRPDLAAPHIQAAAYVDSWQANVILAMARMAYVNGDYDSALKEYERSIQRYGFGPEAFLGQLNCLEKKGKKSQAVKLLEDKLFVEGYSYLDLCSRLMTYEVEAGQKDRARKVMQIILNAPHKTRPCIEKAVQDYRKVDPRDADEIWSRIDKIMAGPDEL